MSRPYRDSILRNARTHDPGGMADSAGRRGRFVLDGGADLNRPHVGFLRNRRSRRWHDDGLSLAAQSECHPERAKRAEGSVGNGQSSTPCLSIDPSARAVPALGRDDRKRRCPPEHHHLAGLMDPHPASGWVAGAGDPCIRLSGLATVKLSNGNRPIQDWSTAARRSPW